MRAKFIKQNYITVEDCLNNPKNLYIFGDNSIRKGKAGQAQIRDCDNSFGIITKRFPSNFDNSFLTDSEADSNLVKNDLKELINIIKMDKYSYVVLPSAGIGTGLAKLPEKAPKIFKLITDFFDELERIL